MGHLDWPSVLVTAEAIVSSYATLVTLRQLFYRLVAAGMIPNALNPYNRLGRLTAEARRDGVFPELADLTRGVEAPLTFTSPSDAMRWAAKRYRLDRTEGQERQLWIVLEKSTLIGQVTEWAWPYGIPVIPLRGYSSRPLQVEAMAAAEEDGRLSHAFYVGDLDPSGEDIEREFFEQVEFDIVERLAVTSTQVTTLGLSALVGKAKDPRAAGFISRHPELPVGRHGEPTQVEVEAIDPNDLERIITDAITSVVDEDILTEVMDQEDAEREHLKDLADEEEATE